jgi:hypothetical protein
MRIVAAFAITLVLAPALRCQAAPIRITGPTVIAFSSPATEDDQDANEALDDFQWYAGQVREPFAKAGIEFHEIQVRSFRVSIRGRVSVIRPKDAEIGYYFIAPGKKPLFHYGVETDSGLFEIAHDYFGITVQPEEEAEE